MNIKLYIHPMTLPLIRSALSAVKSDVITSFCKGLGPAEAKQASNYLTRFFENSLSSGKLARSCLAFDTFAALQPEVEDPWRQSAAKVAASIELLQSFFLVLDDVMDRSELRRGKPCWYRMPGVDLRAINDAMVLDCGAMKVVENEMAGHPKLSALVHDFLETKRLTVVGQSLDMSTRDEPHMPFSWSRYNQIVQNKTSHYTFTLPLRIGFHLANRTGYESLTSLTYRIGHLFQAQDDYLDVFGDVDRTGKNGMDIAEGKCTWLACETYARLQSSTSDSKAELTKVFMENFAQPGEGNVNAVREIMREIGVLEAFRSFENAELCAIQEDVKRIEFEPLKPIFTGILKKLDHRDS